MIDCEEQEDIKKMIDTMLHYLNGGEVFSRPLGYEENEDFELDLSPSWNWGRYEYIPAPKKKVLYAVYQNETLIHVAQSLTEITMLCNDSKCLSYGLPVTKFVEV